MKRAATFGTIALLLAIGAVVALLLPSQADAAPRIAATTASTDFAHYALGDPATVGRDGSVDRARPTCRPDVAAWRIVNGNTVALVRRGHSLGMTVMAVDSAGHAYAANDDTANRGIVEKQVTVHGVRAVKVVVYATNAITGLGDGCNAPRG